MTGDPSSDLSETGGVAGLARSDATAPFWDALANGELRVPHCCACDRHFFPPRRWCPHCWSDRLTWERSAGRGLIYAVTTVHVPFNPGARVPSTVALVDLEEGVRMAGALEPADGGFRVGDDVEIAFHDDPTSTLPVFHRAEDT